MELFFQELGSGKPLFILHGLFGSGDNWMSIARRLSEQYRVILPDLRNHGRSPHSAAWSYELMCADVYQLIERLGLESCTVMGHSMGGKVAMWLACRYPDRIRALLVADMSVRAYPVHHDRIVEGLQAIPVDQIKNRREADQVLADYIPELAIRQFLLKNLSRTPDGRYQWQMNLPVIAAQLHKVVEALPDDFQSTIPALFIRGLRSNYVRDTDIPLIRRHFPHAQIADIAEAGHWLHAEQPEAFIAHVETFLKQL